MNAGLLFPSQMLSGPSASSPGGVPAERGNVTGFGAVLTALSAAVDGNRNIGQNQELSNEQIAVLQDLVELLQKTSLLDLEGGLELGRDLLLEETPLESHPVLEALLQGGISKESLAKLVMGLKETNELNAGSMKELVSSLEESVKAEDREAIEEDVNTLFALGMADLFSIVQAIASLTGEQLQKTDLRSASDVLRFAKIQVLLTEFKDMTAKEAAVHSELKSLLETISGKIQKLLESDELKSSSKTSFAKELAGGNGQNLIASKLNGQTTAVNGQNTDVLKNVYTRLADDLNQKNSPDLQNFAKENLPLKQMDVSQAQPVHFQVSKLEQFALTMERASQPVNQEQFIKAFENILSKANFTSGNGMQKLFIKLNPEHLGSLRIEIIQKDSGLVANIMATTAKAKEHLEGQLQGLKHAFNGQNLQIEKIEVMQTMNSFTQERFLQRESDGSQQHAKNQQQQSDDQQENPEAEFTADLEAALLSMKV